MLHQQGFVKVLTLTLKYRLRHQNASYTHGNSATTTISKAVIHYSRGIDYVDRTSQSLGFVYTVIVLYIVHTAN